METFNMITPLPCGKGWYSKTIPAGFDDSISYLQMLSGVVKKQDEIIRQLNANTEYLKNWDASLDELEQEIITLSEKFDNLEATITADLEAKFNDLKSQLLTLIDMQLTEMRVYVNNEVARLDDRIDNVAIGQITVYDPTTGLISPIQQVINNLYDTGRNDALTATEFDALELTATAFDAYQITAYEFDTQGKNILV